MEQEKEESGERDMNGWGKVRHAREKDEGGREGGRGGGEKGGRTRP